MDRVGGTACCKHHSAHGAYAEVTLLLSSHTSDSAKDGNIHALYVAVLPTALFNKLG
jgi:hypothetical protein